MDNPMAPRFYLNQRPTAETEGRANLRQRALHDVRTQHRVPHQAPSTRHAAPHPGTEHTALGTVRQYR